MGATPFRDLVIPVSSHLQLRALTLADADELSDVVGTNVEHLRRWFDWADGERATQAAFIERCLVEYERGESLNLVMIVDGRIGGTVGLIAINRTHRNAEIGYWIAKPFEGHGLVLAGVDAVVDYSFEVIGLHRLLIQAVVENARSRTVAERLGFVYEGELREAHVVDGRFVSHARYSLLSTDPRPGQPLSTRTPSG